MLGAARQEQNVARGSSPPDSTRGEPVARGQVDASVPSGSARVSMGRLGDGIGEAEQTEWQSMVTVVHGGTSGYGDLIGCLQERVPIIDIASSHSREPYSRLKSMRR